MSQYHEEKDAKMKTQLIALFVAGLTLLGGCIIVPAGPGYYYGHHDRYYRDGYR
jgi:hypothetical protein